MGLVPNGRFDGGTESGSRWMLKTGFFCSTGLLLTNALIVHILKHAILPFGRTKLIQLISCFTEIYCHVYTEATCYVYLPHTSY